MNDTSSKPSSQQQVIQRLQEEVFYLQQRLKSCERQQQWLAAMPHIVWIATVDGSATNFNPLWYEYTGLSPAESLGWEFLKAIHPEDRPATDLLRQQAITLKQAYQLEYRLLKADGSDRLMIEQGTPILDHSAVQEWIVSCTPLPQDTAIEQALQALKESEARFRRVADLNMLGILFWDTSGNITEANDAFLQMVGYTKQDLLSGVVRWEDMTPPEYIHADELALAQLAELGVNTPFEKEYFRKDGSRVPILLGAAMLTGSKHNGVAFAIDLTERNQALEALKDRAEELTYVTRVLAQTNISLEKRNQELDQFAYVASHDLKAPLRAIANLSEWIEEDIGDTLNDENRHQMQLLRGRVHRLEALIDGLLQYSRVGRTAIASESVDVTALLVEVLQDLAPQPFTVAIGQGMPTLNTQRIPLMQVFSNLINNAVKHHDRPNGQVTVSVEDQGQFYEFAVSDDGPGIEQRYHEKIFGIFQTLEARDKVENTGVGLAIVKKIVEGQGGRISVESELGKGATFRFTWSK